MPVDIEAPVRYNRRLSARLQRALAARAGNARAAARPDSSSWSSRGRGLDPLLRRPFSVFEILRDAAGAPTGFSILNKRVGVTTTAALRRERRAAVAVPRPARPAVHAGGRAGTRRGWWPAASAWRRLPRWPRRCAARGVPTDAVLRRAQRRRSVLPRLLRALGVDARAHHRRRQPRRARPRHRAARTRAGGARRGRDRS